MDDARRRILEDLVGAVRSGEAALNVGRSHNVPSEAVLAVVWLVEGLGDLVGGRSVRPAEVLFVPVLQLVADYLEAPGVLAAVDEVEQALRVAVMDLGDGYAPGVQSMPPMLVAAVHLLDMVVHLRAREAPWDPDVAWTLRSAAKALSAARRADVGAQVERDFADVIERSRPATVR